MRSVYFSIMRILIFRSQLRKELDRVNQELSEATEKLKEAKNSNYQLNVIRNILRLPKQHDLAEHVERLSRNYLGCRLRCYEMQQEISRLNSAKKDNKPLG